MRDTVSMRSTASLGGERDLRLDFFRGLALFCIFIDHIPENWLAQFTLQSIGFSDAAEAFILISGYTAGMVYGRAFDRQGRLVATARVYHRVWQLYVAHVFLFMLFMAMVARTAGSLNASIYSEEFGAADFINEPDVAVLMALILRFQPAFMDILPLYIVLLAGLPLVLVGFRTSPLPVLMASFLLWLAVQFNGSIALPAYPGPDQEWFFNPFAWQALFYFSAWLGWRSTQDRLGWLRNRWLFYAAIAVVGSCFFIRLEWTVSERFESVPTLFATVLWPLLSKTELSVLRFLNVLALALLISRLIPSQAGFFSGRLARPFLMCGRHSLHIFCLGILLSVIAHLFLNEYFGGRILQLVVVSAGIGIMIGVAAWMDWFEYSNKRAPSATQSVGGGTRGGFMGDAP